MKFPPVDIYRAPFIGPIGHLAMQSAHAEDELISLCSRIPFDGSPDQLPPGDTAHKLRNWSGSTIQFIEQRLSLIPELHLRNQARDAVSRYVELRNARHRAVHDALALGILQADDGYITQALSVEYRRNKQATSVYLNVVTPEEIADLACQMYDVQKDLNMITYALNPPQ
ncbi:hypothetical protein [Phyllobacterium chamaecytisi]|uniref:hypothetical protein n=1 Tax=Phyllobacterium chamaecytisi TaxID=2876082 RepID=UPI001CCD639C|nr:hypothetical protein [Phyllobacterium sp. KW56]MBZ9603946.1 hypothetical protein [Phyllobacterium sp. KW56]